MSSIIETAKVFDVKGLVSYSHASTVSKILTKNANGNTTLFAFDKGQELSEHTAPFDAVVLITEGTAEVTINGKAHQLKEGQLIVMPANIPHAVKAIEKFKMLLIMIKG